MILQKTAPIMIYFVDKNEHILKKTMINNDDYVLYNVISCKKENTLKFYQILVDFEFTLADQMYIISRPLKCQLSEKIDPLTYLKPDKTQIYLQNINNNSIAKQIGKPQLVMYFNVKCLQGKAKQNVAEQFGIQIQDKQIAQPQQQIQIQKPAESLQLVTPIQIQKPKQDIQKEQLIKQVEPVQPQVQLNNIGYIIILFYTLAGILFFISFIIMACTLARVVRGYRPNGLIVKNNLVFEDQNQNQQVINQNEMRYQKANFNQLYEKTLYIDNFIGSNVTLNNSYINGSEQSQETCNDIAIDYENLQGRESISIYADNLNISQMNNDFSLINIGDQVVNITSDNVQVDSLDTTSLTFQQNQPVNVQTITQVQKVNTNNLECQQLNANSTAISNTSQLSVLNTTSSQLTTINNCSQLDIQNGTIQGTGISTNNSQIQNGQIQNMEIQNYINITGQVNATNIINNVSNSNIENANASTLQQLENQITINNLQAQNMNDEGSNQVDITNGIINQSFESNVTNIQNVEVQNQINTPLIEVYQNGSGNVNSSLTNIDIGGTILNYSNNQIQSDQIDCNIQNLTLSGNSINSSTINQIIISEGQQVTTDNLITNVSQTYDLNSDNTNTTTLQQQDGNINVNQTVSNSYANQINDTQYQAIQYNPEANQTNITSGVFYADNYAVQDGDIGQCLD